MDWIILAVLFLIPLLLLYRRRHSTGPITIRSLTIYPIKSCAGIPVTESLVSSTGMFMDREWVLVDRSGEMVTARQDPRLWNIHPQIDLRGTSEPVEMTITYEEKQLRVDLTKPLGEKITLNVFREKAEVADQGREVAEWLQTTLGKDYRLFRIVSPRVHNPEEVFTPPETIVALPDLLQILLISESSLQQLIASSPEPKKSQLTMSCFRPNIVVGGATPFEEDSWQEITIDSQRFIGAAPCPRCLMTTIDPKTLQFDPKTEPLPTLRRIHGVGLKGYLGQWFLRTCNGRVKVGDEIIVRKYKNFPK